jgi:hypothetical protein
MRFSFAIVLFTQTGSSASAGSQIVPGFMSRLTHVSSPVIWARKRHLSCACRMSRSCQEHSNSFALKSSSRKWGSYLNCRVFILREVVRWRYTVDAGILRNSAIVRTENHGSASKTCGTRVSTSSRGGRPELGRSLRSGQCNVISCSHYFTLFSSNASSR